MNQHLLPPVSRKCVVVRTFLNDQGKHRQNIVLRIKAKGRKLVAIGIFDVAKKDVLAVPIFNVMRSMAVFA